MPGGLRVGADCGVPGGHFFGDSMEVAELVSPGAGCLGMDCCGVDAIRYVGRRRMGHGGLQFRFGHLADREASAGTFSSD